MPSVDGLPDSARARQRFLGSADVLGGARGDQEFLHQRAEFAGGRPFGQRCRYVLGCTPDLVETVGEIIALVPGQHHRISW